MAKAKKPAKKQVVKKTVKKPAAKKAAVKKAAAPAQPKWWAKGYASITTYLNCRDVETAYNFYQKAFGFTAKAIMKMPDGKAMHAEVAYNGSSVMMGPENDMVKAYSPAYYKGSPASIYVYVKDVDTFCSKAKSAGAKCLQEPKDEFWGDRVCLFVDTEGYSWCFATHLKDLTMAEMMPK